MWKRSCRSSWKIGSHVFLPNLNKGVTSFQSYTFRELSTGTFFTNHGMRETRAMRRGDAPQPPVPTQRSGGKSFKLPEDTIERTDEYLTFMEKLEEFHEEHGTSLQKEPILGSKKLDLYKIYQMVTEAGGCKKVSEERGWRKITLPFNLPATCTNSAYAIKNIYIKFLEGYEMKNFWGQEITFDGHKTSSSAERVGGSDRSDRENDDRHRHRHRHELRNRERQFQSSREGSKSSNANEKTSFTTIKEPLKGNMTPFSRKLFAPPSNAIEMQTLEPPALKGPWREGYYLEGGHHNRMLLALRSSLPNEIDWAFKRLIKLSLECSDTFHVDKIPGLVDALLSFAAPFFEECSKVINNRTAAMSDPIEIFDNIDDSMNDAFFDSIGTQQRHQRVFQAFLVIRNLSFLEHNIKLMAAYKPLRKYLMEGLKLQVLGHFTELRQYCLDIIENICPYVFLKGPDEELLKVLPELLYSNDKALVMGGIRSMTSLALNEHNLGVLRDIEARIIQRMMELLLIEDEELVAAVLDWLYQFLELHEDIAYRIVQYAPGNFVRLMIRFLRWQALDYVKAAFDDIMPIVPKLQLSGAFNQLPEPYRTIEWLKLVYEYVPNESVLQTEVWFAYREQFLTSTIPMMPAAEVIKHVNRAFPESAVMMVTAPDSTTKYMIQGIQRRSYTGREQPSSKKSLKFTCRWNGCLAPPFISGEEVYRHILYHHLPNKHIQSQQPENSILYDCNWMECRRFNPGTTNRGAVQAHLKIHFPIEPDAVPHPPSPYPVLVTPTPLDQRRNFLTYRTNISSDQDGEAIGIPLTACLILRNMSRSKKMAPYFVAYETELSDILVKCRPLSKYLAETMYNLRNLTV